MSIRDIIIAQTRLVVSSLSSGTPWSLYARTATSTDDAPVYSGTAVEITVLDTGYNTDDGEFGTASGKRESLDIRVSSASGVALGDKINDGTDDYVVVARLSGGPTEGTERWRIRVDSAREFGPARGGRLSR